ncbi:MAG: hypothetical protein ACKVQA_11255 [Burkholderiales bacterium]
MQPAHLKDLTEQVVVLSIERLSLVFPQHEIRTLEPVLDLEPGEYSLSVGDIVLDEGTWPVFSLTEDLELLASAPERARVCVLMSHEKWRFGLLCDKVANKTAQDMMPKRLPECMRQGTSVVHGLCVAENQVMCLTRAESMWRYLGSLGCGFAEYEFEDQRDLSDLTATMILRTVSL